MMIKKQFHWFRIFKKSSRRQFFNMINIIDCCLYQSYFIDKQISWICFMIHTLNQSMLQWSQQYITIRIILTVCKIIQVCFIIKKITMQTFNARIMTLFYCFFSINIHAVNSSQVDNYINNFNSVIFLNKIEKIWQYIFIVTE